MSRVDLILAAHNHQPVGNFEHVIEDAYQRAYAPFLEILEQHPGVRFALHQPGFLWEWLERQHPEYVERVRRLVQRGQLELLGGAFYEPILPVIPERDRQGQIAKLAAWLADRFGVRPRGAWVAERVWEPQLASTLARAGLEFSILDDAHFKSAGVPASALDGYWITEDEGHTLRVFPISQKLRYLIPFAPPEDCIEFLRGCGDVPGRAERPLLVLADDGEKFGVWSSTHDLCYRQGWLERFFARLEENAAWLRTIHFATALDELPPRGRTYLPTASYAEMMEWALPPAAQHGLQRAVERVTSGDGDATELRTFVRGGFWRNFLAKYPESNWMHKKMLATSRALEERAASGDTATLREAEDALWRGQCNCAYWHGLFGGLYLPHLRSAVYGNLIRAERALERLAAAPPCEERDFDADGRLEVILRSESLLAVVKPDEGGAVFELDERRLGFNLLDLMTRREEAYHEKLLRLTAAKPEDEEASGAQAPEGGAVSIHELVAMKEAGLARKLVYDAYRRGSGIDHCMALHADAAALEAARLPEMAALAGQPYTWKLEDAAEGSTPVLRLERRVPLALPEVPLLHVTKRLRLLDAALELEYTLQLQGAASAEFLFGIEMAVNLLAGDAPDRYYDVPGLPPEERRLASAGVLCDVHEVALVDEWLGLRVRFETDAAGDIWRAPLESVSMSEGGFERVYQGSVLLFVNRVVLHPGQCWTRLLRQTIELR